MENKDITRIQPVTAKQVLHLYGGVPSKGQLMKLCEHQVVVPCRESTGAGSNRLFDWYNLLEIAVWRELHSLSINAPTAALFLKAMREQALCAREQRPRHRKEYLILGIALGGVADVELTKSSRTHYHILAKPEWITMERKDSGYSEGDTAICIRAHALSRRELTRILTEKTWYPDSRGAEVFPLHNNMIIIDLQRIRNFIADHFGKQNASNLTEKEATD